MTIQEKLEAKVAWQRSELKALLIELGEKALRHDDIHQLVLTQEWQAASDKKRSVAKLESALDEMRTASLENWEPTTQQA